MYSLQWSKTQRNRVDISTDTHYGPAVDVLYLPYL